MSRTRSPLIIILMVLCPWGLPGAMAESGSPPHIQEVHVGLGGIFKVGYWTPVRLQISGGETGFSGQIEFTAPDSDDVTTRLVPSDDAPLEIAPGGNWTGWRYVKVGRLRSIVRVGLRDGAGTLVAERTLTARTPQPATCPWVITAGTDVQVEQAGVFLTRMREEKLIASRLTDVAEFPDRWYGYEGVNVLLVPTGDVTPLERLSEEQFAALDHWLRMGGRLLLTAGHRAEELFAPEHRFHAFRPGTLVELDTYWKASGLEGFARAAERLQSDGTAPLAVFRDLQGAVICYEGAGGSDDRALVVQSPYGFGEITYLALDLDRSPLADWPARARLLARLLQTRGEDEDTAGDQRVGQVTHVGFEDLSGQLRAALDQFPGVTLVQFSWVAGLLVAYVLLIGPFDFFGLRWLKRPQWTWITFPLFVLLFGVLSVWLFGRWKGTQPQINQADIVDVDVVGQFVRGTTWAHIYSPHTTRLGIDVQPQPTWPSAQPNESAQADHQVLTSWQGLPGSGWGGMTNSATVDVLSDLSDEYLLRYPLHGSGHSLSEGLQLDGLPIHTASSKSIIARWSAATELASASDLTADRNHLLRGTVSNVLDVELTHCRLYYQNWAYPLEGTLAPGATARVGSGTPLDLRWRLTRRSVVGTQEVRSYWRTDDVSDMDRILEVLMFYGAAGGRSYTGLTHNYQSFIDLSRHLRSGRAILVGRCARPASQVEIRAAGGAGGPAESVASEQQHWCYYRIVLPVQSAQDAAGD